MKFLYTLFVLIVSAMIIGVALIYFKYQNEILIAAISAGVGLVIGLSWGSVSEIKKRARLENELEMLRNEIEEIKGKIEPSKEIENKIGKESFSSKLFSIFSKKEKNEESEALEVTNGEENAS